MKIRVPVKPKRETVVPDFREAVNPETKNSTITLANVRPADNPENVVMGAQYMEQHGEVLRQSINHVRDFILETVAVQSLSIENGSQDAREVLTEALGEEPDLTHIVEVLRNASRTAVSLQTVDFILKFAHLPAHLRPVLVAVCLGSRTDAVPSLESVLKRLESAMDRAPRVDKPKAKPFNRHQEEERVVRRRGEA